MKIHIVKIRQILEKQRKDSQYTKHPHENESLNGMIDNGFQIVPLTVNHDR